MFLSACFDLANLNVHNKNATMMVYFGITKAFAHVPHERLLLKLKPYGLADPLYSWLTFYLSDPSQVITINETLSQPEPTPGGVIQGSVLGPSVFLLYGKDILWELRHGAPFLFADGIKVF